MKPLFVLLVLVAVLAGCATAPGPAARAAEPAPQPVPTAAAAPARVDAMVERWGIESRGIRRTSGGFMLDFRFRVLDAAKAAPLFDRATKPYLLDPATGAKFMVPSPPKTGPLRTSEPPREGIVYWMFFANPGRYLGPGAEVTVVIGDFRAENLVVE
jgi:hypothetical protein